MAIPKNVFLGLIYKFLFTGITALRLCVLTSKNVRLYALTQRKSTARSVVFFRWHRYLCGWDSKRAAAQP